MINPYHVVTVGKTATGEKIYGIKYKEITYQFVQFPDSWGTKDHAVEYLASRLGLTKKEFMEAKKNGKI